MTRLVVPARVPSMATFDGYRSFRLNNRIPHSWRGDWSVKSRVMECDGDQFCLPGWRLDLELERRPPMPVPCESTTETTALESV